MVIQDPSPNHFVMTAVSDLRKLSSLVSHVRCVRVQKMMKKTLSWTRPGHVLDTSWTRPGHYTFFVFSNEDRTSKKFDTEDTEDMRGHGDFNSFFGPPIPLYSQNNIIYYTVHLCFELR